MRAATAEGEHAQVVGIGAVDAPFLVRVIQFSTISWLPLGFFAQNRLGGFQIDMRLVQTQPFAKGAHPQVILIKLLAAGQRAPWISSCTLV